VSAALVPGSFDPPTRGHLDVIHRAAALFDRVVVAVVTNPGKAPLFAPEERVALLRSELAELGGVEVIAAEGLLVALAERLGITTVVKGLRGASDLDAELAMARMNRRMGGVETLLLPSDPAHADVSSSLVKEIARLGGPLDGVVPPAVAAALTARLR
jgi:pantetheine-phosphate adenylyltransferase